MVTLMGWVELPNFSRHIFAKSAFFGIETLLVTKEKGTTVKRDTPSLLHVAIENKYVSYH